jgi:hypothetical protein
VRTSKRESQLYFFLDTNRLVNNHLQVAKRPNYWDSRDTHMLVEYKSEFLFAQTGRKDPANAAV